MAQQHAKSGLGSCLESMPALRTLDASPRLVLGCSLPISHVTSYRSAWATDPSEAWQLAVLSKMPELESRALLTQSETPIAPLMPVQLLHLHELRLYNVSVKSNFNSLQRFALVNNEDIQFDSFLSFVASCKTTLEELIIYGPLTPDECILLLEAITRFQDLFVTVKGPFDLDKLCNTPALGPSSILNMSLR
ncbi:hypothetical protein C8J56DRAFT_1062131 [Mycena floridula]|nr:hypothetical protein C8J56DRAFT_1062131 [Mycena floridula]